MTHTYYYAGNKLLRETYGSNTLDFFYNADGSPYAFKYNGTPYYYITNLQGDVMRIVDADAVCVGVYRYDPYGNLVSSSGDLVSVNPLRYRSYYFDSETGFYYLQSRYYDPELGRFINADDFASTGQGILGHNMFAYCNNNPTGNADTEGNLPRDILNPNPMGRNSGCSLHPIADKDRKDLSTGYADRCGTLFVGYSLSCAYGASESVTVGAVVDTYLNVGFVITPAVGGGFPAAGIGKVWGTTNAPTIYDLAGWSGQVGGSINAYGGSIGLETSFFSNPQNGESYKGLAFMLGGKAAWLVELHGTLGYSFVYGVNLFDILICISKALN